jgi:amino acid adenylation domain-containing protein
MNAFTTPRVFPTNFVDHLQTLAAQRPNDTAVIIVSERNGATTDAAITYFQLDQRVRALAAHLQRQFATGDRVLLLLDNDDNYVAGFLACLYAGLIAVPVFPPTSARPQHLARLVGVARDAGAVCAMTTTMLQSSLAPFLQDLPGVAAIAVDDIDERLSDDWSLRSPQGNEIAFLQYTSGSTSAPKGVMVSHDNLMANERAIELTLAMRENDVFVSWLPLYHDMGLIGGLLQPLHRGIPAVLMTPQFFLEKPLRWLEAISRHRGTVSGGPDFSYRLCLERISDTQRSQLDLSCWRLAFSGAEPVRRDTLTEFVETFAEAGFSAASVYPCYGLAEATLLVTGGMPRIGMTANTFSTQLLAQGIARHSDSGSELVACGHVVADHTVAIIDTQTSAKLDDGRTGEIWVSGPSVAEGYWNKPVETAAAFVERAGRRWLRTGDYGVVIDGQVYIVGRIKDLIIVRGHNIYPQDIERAIEDEIDVARKGRIAAFSVTTPKGEGIGVAVELSRRTQKLVPAAQLVEALNAVVSQQCGEPLSVITLLDSGMLPKTSSGKLQRSACTARWSDADFGAYAIYADGKLWCRDNDANGDDISTAAAEPASGTTEASLAGLWRQVLKLADTTRLHGQSHFLSVGGSSISAAQLGFLISEQWQIEFPLRTFFECPLLAEQAKEVDRRCGEGQRSARLVIPALPTAQRISSLPISSAQHRQWFLWQLDTESTAYHIGGVVRLQGALSESALQAAVDDLTQRHEALRTVFRCDVQGDVCQVIQPSLASAFSIVELQDQLLSETELQQHDQIQRIAGKPFDLAQGPLWRCALLRGAGNCNALALIMHHIISDAASLQLIIDELSQRYLAHTGAATTPTNLPALTIQYADYAVWQRHWLAQGESERQLHWWREQLGNEHPVLQLPVDRPRQAEARYRATRHSITVPAMLPAQLRQQAGAAQATLFMALLANFQALLHRYTGQHDIRVGVPVANRHHAQTQNVVGFFVNTLVMRNVMNGRDSLVQVTAQARNMALGAQEHQDLPFELLVEALRPERSLSHTPLFQVMFNYLQEDFRALANLSDGRTNSGHSDFSTALVERIDGAAQFELTLEAREQPDGSLLLDLVYAAELFDAQTMVRFGEHYVRMLQQFARDPLQPLGDIELSGTAERTQLQQWSSNTVSYPGNEPLHRLFEQQVALNPESPAVLFNREILSYGALNARANRLAHYLTKQGVKRETRVGIAVERSLEMIICLLAVLKAGATYVPLDPEYPPQRLQYMIEDSGISLLLTQQHVQAIFPAFPPQNVLLLDVVDLTTESTVNPQTDVHSENLAYVIYTSGSTGLPKGAANRHAAVVSCMRWMQHTYVLSKADTVLHKAPFGFDVSVWEIFWPLTAGARLVVANPGDHRDPDRLIELIRDHKITTVNFVPAMLQAFLECDGIEYETCLRYVICGGEAMPAATQKNALQRLRGVSLQNLYGPTETAIHITQWTCRDDGDVQVPIGRPIAASHTHVLDSDLNAVPQGVAGELYLGGVGLGRGYLNRPALTAERFVASPFTPGERLYRTGDLVRWNSEGQLEYLGRIDQQVKIRGFRIEPGEIEAQLLARSNIREAVVVAKDNAHLIAYIAVDAQDAPDIEELKQQLSKALPDYMVPRAFVVLPHLPLNANGKVDRNALPQPEFASAKTDEPARGRTEEMLAQVWCQLLELDHVGRHDNFFDLGGHSLHLGKVRKAIEKDYGTVAISDLFKYPTISALARRIERNPAESMASDIEFLQRQEERAQQQRAARLRRRNEKVTS